MKDTKSSEKITLDPVHPINHFLDVMKIGHSVLSGLMSKHPVSTAILTTNDAIFNIAVSSTAQQKSLGKSTIEYIGGFAAGSVCTIITIGRVEICAAICGYFGGEISGKLYDTIAQFNGYTNLEEFAQKRNLFNTGPTFQEILSRYEVLDTLCEGDYAYVNSPFRGAQLYVKQDGILQKMTEIASLPEFEFMEQLSLKKSSLQINVSAKNTINIKIDSASLENNILSNYEIQVTESHTNKVTKLAYSNLEVAALPAVELDPEILQTIKELNRELHQALYLPKKDLYKKIDLLLSQGANINSREICGGKTLLHKTENQHLIKYLLSKGARVDMRDNFGLFPIHYRYQSSLTCRELLIKAAITQRIDLQTYFLHSSDQSYMKNAFEICMSNKEYQLVKLMIENGVSVNIEYRNVFIIEYFVREIRQCNEQREELIAIVDFLLKNGADLCEGKLLFIAIDNKAYDLTYLLINAGSPVDYEKNKEGVLHLLIRQCSNTIYFSGSEPDGFSEEIIFIINLLIKKGINIDAKYCSSTALEYILSEIHQHDYGFSKDRTYYIQGFEEVAILLIESGVDLKYINDEGKTYLNMAVNERLDNIVEKLLMSGILKKINNAYAFRALEDAVMGNIANIAMMLAKARVKIIVNDHEESLLLRASNLNIDWRIIDALCHAFIEQEMHEYIDWKSSLGDTALVRSLDKQYTETAEILLKYGADINEGFSDKEEMSPFHLAAFQGRVETVNFYIKHGIDLNSIYGSRHGNVLYYAICNKNQIIAIKLLEAGADSKIKSGLDRLDTWEYVIQENCVEVAKYMLKHGSVVTAENLYYVAAQESLEMLELLLQNSPHMVNCTDRWFNQSLLHVTAHNLEIEKVKLLVKFGANVNLQRAGGEIPLELALKSAYRGSSVNEYKVIEIMKILIEAGTILESTSGKQSLLSIAASFDNVKPVKYLIDQGLKIDDIDEYSQSAIYYADSLEVVQLLVNTAKEIGLDVEKYINANNKYGHNVLWKHATNIYHYASDNSLKIVQYLLDNGANPNIKYKNKSLLHKVIENGLEKMTKLLLSYGAKVDISDLALAKDKFDDNIIKELEIKIDFDQEDDSLIVNLAYDGYTYDY